MFEVSTALNDLADKLTNIPGISRIVKNPIYTALIITIIIMFVLLFIFRDVESSEPLLIVTLRSGFYIFIIMIGVIFLHNHVLMNEINQSSQTHKDIFENSIIENLENDKMPINTPNAFS